MNRVSPTITSDELHAGTVRGELEVSFQLSPEHRGRGLAHEAVEAAGRVDRLFEILGIDLVGTSSHRFEGSASVPYPGNLNEHPDEVWQEGPQRLLSKVTGGASLEVPLLVVVDP